MVGGLRENKLKMFVKKILKILTKKDKKKFFFSIILLINKSFIEVLSIGLLIPILNFVSNEDKQSFVYDYLPFLHKLNNKEIIVFFVFIFIFIYLIKTVYVMFYNRWNARFVNNLSVDLTQRVLDRYLSKNYIFFLENNSASLVRNLSFETSLFASGLVGGIVLSITHLVFIISICSFLIIYNFYSLYVILILALLSALIVKLSSEKFKKWGLVRQEESASFLKKLNEVIGSIKEVILYNKKLFFLKEVYLHNKQLAKANIYRDTSISFTTPIIEFVGIFTFFSFLLFLILYSSLNLGEIIVLFGIFAFASIKLLPAVIGFVRSIQSIKFNLPACDVIHQILNDPVDIYHPLEIEENVKIKLNNIQFENVSFSYRSQKSPTLNNLTFEINKGDRVAVIGETGSGKTTLLNLISSLVFPSNGKIKINNLDKPNLYKEIRHHIGYVSQSVYLSDNSILFNVALTNEVKENERKKIMSILDSMNLSFINNEPINELSSIGERGSKLSGGQIQRIGIARALFRDPDILILDESTNALDEENEAQIINFLLQKFEKKIIIFCTHKKEVLKYCNKILEVKNNIVSVKQNYLN